MRSSQLGAAVVTTLLFSSSAYAQVPAPVTFNGSLFQNGQAADGNFTVRFSLYDSSTSETPLAQADVDVLVSFGSFTAEITSLFSMDTQGSYLGVEVSPSGMDAFEPLSRVQLTATPYAVRSSRADVATSVD
ncbi:MAG: hypothetical protein AAFY60_14965, partial [Myxococcota bacterium]